MKDKESVDIANTAPWRTGEDLRFGRQIGAGGIGVIHEVRDPALRREMAVKLLKKTTPQRPKRRTRFLHEAQITAQLDHPHILPVYELGEHPEHGLFFTMKVVEGGSLGEVIQAVPLNYRTSRHIFALLQIFLKVCDAVSFAHSRGVIHRDLKPDNIMVASFGRVYLMDWGVALVKSMDSPVTGKEFVGTPQFMAPEQAAGHVDALDERADIFALGGILYQVITQQPARASGRLREMCEAAAMEEIVHPQEVTSTPLPARLCAVVMKAMAFNPEDRYQSVQAMKEDVELFLQSGWQFPVESYRPGSMIVREEEAGSSAYVIISGHCRAFKGEHDNPQELREMGPGDVFGETAVFLKQPRSATVETMDEVTVMAISRDHFNDDLGLGEWMGLFVNALADRFLEKEQRVLELEQRVAELEHLVSQS